MCYDVILYSLKLEKSSNNLNTLPLINIAYQFYRIFGWEENIIHEKHNLLENSKEIAEFFFIW